MHHTTVKCERWLEDSEVSTSRNWKRKAPSTNIYEIRGPVRTDLGTIKRLWGIFLPQTWTCQKIFATDTDIEKSVEKTVSRVQIDVTGLEKLYFHGDQK